MTGLIGQITGHIVFRFPKGGLIKILFARREGRAAGDESVTSFTLIGCVRLIMKEYPDMETAKEDFRKTLGEGEGLREVGARG